MLFVFVALKVRDRKAWVLLVLFLKTALIRFINVEKNAVTYSFVTFALLKKYYHFCELQEIFMIQWRVVGITA